MELVWKIALGVAGIGAVGAFVFWSVYRKWLDVGKATFASLTKEQTYNLFRLLLVLTFVFAVIAVIAFVWTNQQALPATRAEGGDRDIVDDKGQFARLDNYKGTDWVLKNRIGPLKFQRVPLEGEPPLSLLTAPDDPLSQNPDACFFPAISFDLVKLAKHDTVRVQSIRVNHQPVPGHWAACTSNVTHPNVRPPILFLADIRGAKGSTEAVVTDGDGKPSPNSWVTLTEAEPVARFVVGFTGAMGPHRVHISVDLQETRSNRKLQVSSERCVWVGVPQKETEP